MNHPVDHSLQLAPEATTGQVEGLAGCWKLGAGSALRLRVRRAGVLRIAHGRVWVTLDHPEQNSTQRAGDHFLSRGESLTLLPGESLVMESFGIGHVPSAYFSWEPARVARSVPASHVGGLGMVGRAVTRVATAFAISFVAARARCTSAERSFKTQTCE